MHMGNLLDQLQSICLLFRIIKVDSMGQCVSKNNNLAKSPRHLPNNSPNEGTNNYGIVMQTSENALRFCHSPLSSCEFLHNKFSRNPAPEEVNLSFMVLNVQIDPSENLLHFTVMHEKEINVYVVLGGEEQVSNTGLTVSISKAKYMEKMRLSEPKPKGEDLTIVPARMDSESIFIILEPLLKNGQTMFIVERHTCEGEKQYRRKSQTLQWCSLSFDLQDVYGSDNLFKCNSGEQCTVCLSSPANVILAPCRHMCMCSDCSSKYEKTSKKCPICRTEFRSIIGYK